MLTVADVLNYLNTGRTGKFCLFATLNKFLKYSRLETMMDLAVVALVDKFRTNKY